MRISKQNIFYGAILIFWLASSVLFAKLSYSAGIIISIIGIIFYLSLNMDRKYLFILSTLPMAAVFKISANVPSTIVLLYFLFLGEYYIRVKKVERKLLIFVFTFFISQITAMVCFGSSLVPLLSLTINIIFCYVAFNYLRVSAVTMKQCAVVMAISLGIDILVATLFPQAMYQISYEKQMFLARAGRFAAFNGDPNYYSQLVAVVACLVFAVALNSKEEYKKRCLWGLVGIWFAVEGLRSGSKSYVIVLVILAGFMAWLIIHNSPRNKAYVLKVTIIMIIGVIAVALLFTQVLVPLFTERAKDHTSLLSNRDIIWAEYIHNFLENPLLWLVGTGILNGGILADGSAAHNVYIELLAETGIIGVSAVLAVQSSLLKKFLKNAFRFDALFVWVLLITSMGLALSSNDAVFVLLPIMAVCEGNINAK